MMANYAPIQFPPGPPSENGTLRSKSAVAINQMVRQGKSFGAKPFCQSVILSISHFFDLSFHHPSISRFAHSEDKQTHTNIKRRNNIQNNNIQHNDIQPNETA
jgi:hypothetical protein